MDGIITTASHDLRLEIERRLGFFPPLLAPALPHPLLLEHLWQQTLHAYLDNPLPPLFKEQLFAYLSRLVAVPYCLACHGCALRGLGMSAAAILALLAAPTPDARAARAAAARLEVLRPPLHTWPAPGSSLEEALRTCAVVLFLEDCEDHEASEDADGGACSVALCRALGEPLYEHLVVFLGHVRFCHQWARAHPELDPEADERVRVHLGPLRAAEPRLGELLGVGPRRARPRASRSGQGGGGPHKRGGDTSERALRESEERFRATFEQAAAGMAHTALDGRWLRVNQKLCDITGYRREELLARRFQDIIHPDDLAADLAQVEQLLAGNIATYSMDKRYLRKDGSPVWIELTVSLVRDEAGAPSYFIGVIVDISQRKRAEEAQARLHREAQEAIRVRDEFLSVASHELKTPLTPLRLQVQSLLRSARQHSDAALPLAELSRRLRPIERSVARLEELIDSLLDISRIRTGHLELAPRPVDLVEIARDGVARFAEEAERTNTPIRLHAPAPVIGCWDRARLDQVVTNLLGNALRYGAEKPVEIGVERAGAAARLWVQDQGIGIPPEHQERIFECFERAVSERHYGGFGLGLWISREIVQAHGGRISVRSQAGAGSTFLVELPLLSPSGTSRATERSP